MQNPISIFQISKLRHAEMMMKMRSEYPDIHFTARWPITAPLGSEDMKPVWQWMREAESEIVNSNCVMVYVEIGEVLKTGLLQVGIAYTRRIPIFVVGEHPSYAEWQFEQYMVKRVPTIKAAINAARIMFRGKQESIGRQIGPVPTI